MPARSLEFWETVTGHPKELEHQPGNDYWVVSPSDGELAAAGVRHRARGEVDQESGAPGPAAERLEPGRRGRPPARPRRPRRRRSSPLRPRGLGRDGGSGRQRVLRRESTGAEARRLGSPLVGRAASYTPPDGSSTQRSRQGPPAEGARLHGAGPRSARGRVRGERRTHAGEPRDGEAGGPRLGLPRDQPHGGERRPRTRSVRADADRGAMGPRHRSPVGHPVEALDPPRGRHRGAEGALPSARLPRRAPGRLRDHRGGRRLRPDDGGDVRQARRRHVDDHGREMARDLG